MLRREDAISTHDNYGKDTDPHLKNLTPLAFRWQQWLRECASMLRCTYITCRIYVTRTFTLTCFKVTCHNLAATQF
jgi:hypothetical protein